jgi:hypothetical protein
MSIDKKNQKSKRLDSCNNYPVNLEYLKEDWPRPFVYRGEISSFSQGMYSPYHLANLDCHNQGPAGRFKIGGKVAYPVDSLIEWLHRRVQAA